MDKKLFQDVRKELEHITAFDVHCHIDPVKPQAQDIGDIIFYHGVVREIYSAGGDDELLFSDAPLEQRMNYFFEYLPIIENTATMWSVKKILKDLYGIAELNKNTWKTIQMEIEQKKNESMWPEQLMVEQMKLQCSYSCSSWYGNWSKIHEKPYLKLHLEGLAFGPIMGKGLFEYLSKNGKDLKTAEKYFSNRLQEMMNKEFMSIGVCFDYLYKPVFYSKSKTSRIYDKLVSNIDLSSEEKNALSTHFLYQLLEQLHGKVTVQVILGAIWGNNDFILNLRNAESYTIVNHELILSLLQIFKDFQDTRFNIYSCSMALSQEITILARMLPNVSLLGFWWHNLFPVYIEKSLNERIEALPANKWILIASDAYNSEWSYGKISLVKNCFAGILAQKIENNYMTLTEAISLAERVMYENPKQIYKIYR